MLGEEGRRALVVGPDADPQGRPPERARLTEDLVQQLDLVAAAAVVGVDRELGVHQVPVVVHRRVHPEMPHRLAGVVEEQGEAGGLEVGAVTDAVARVLDGQDERVRVVDGAGRLDHPGEGLDLPLVVRVDLHQLHRPRFSRIAYQCRTGSLAHPSLSRIPCPHPLSRKR
ncbi:MAG TPA: hypothetical protein VGC37_20215 [Friedmanniella sp.]